MSTDDPQPLPVFRYYPAAEQKGAFPENDGLCAGCLRRRGRLYDGVIYGENVTSDERFCPWCISEGRVADRGGFINQTQEMVADTPEVDARTPGFASWQDLSWPVHHDRPGIFHGVVGAAELQALDPQATEAMRLTVSDWGWDTVLIDEFLSQLSMSGSPTGYLWSCAECGQYIAQADFS